MDLVCLSASAPPYAGPWDLLREAARGPCCALRVVISMEPLLCAHREHQCSGSSSSLLVGLCVPACTDAECHGGGLGFVVWGSMLCASDVLGPKPSACYLHACAQAGARVVARVVWKPLAGPASCHLSERVNVQAGWLRPRATDISGSQFPASVLCGVAHLESTREHSRLNPCNSACKGQGLGWRTQQSSQPAKGTQSVQLVDSSCCDPLGHGKDHTRRRPVSHLIITSCW